MSMANDKVKIKIRALQPISIGPGQILQAGEEAEIERTQASIDVALAQGLYEFTEDTAQPEVPANG